MSASLSLPSLHSPVYQAVCLERLTAQEMLAKLSEKVGLQACQVSSLLHLTSSGILVLVDDTVSAHTTSTQPVIRGRGRREVGREGGREGGGGGQGCHKWKVYKIHVN